MFSSTVSRLKLNQLYRSEPYVSSSIRRVTWIGHRAAAPQLPTLESRHQVAAGGPLWSAVLGIHGGLVSDLDLATGVARVAAATPSVRGLGPQRAACNLSPAHNDEGASSKGIRLPMLQSVFEPTAAGRYPASIRAARVET